MKRNILISILVLAAMLDSCTTELPVSLELVEEELVVNAFISPDSLIGIELSHTKAIPGTTGVFTPIPDATVILFEDGNEIETLRYFENPAMKFNEQSGATCYRSNTVYPEIGKIYRVEVSHPDYDDVSCETTIPVPVKIISIDTINNESSYYNPVRLTFKDSLDFDNYYRILVRAKWGLLITDYGDNQNDNVISIYTTTITEIATEDVLIVGLSDESTDYMVGPPDNNYSIFPDNLINGQQYTIKFTIPGKMIRRVNGSEFQPEKGEFYYVEIELQSISCDEYLYLTTCNSYFYYGYDFTTEPVMVYSNVENGTGIFAGYSVDRYILSEGEYPKTGVNYVYDTK